MMRIFEIGIFVDDFRTISVIITLVEFVVSKRKLDKQALFDTELSNLNGLVSAFLTTRISLCYKVSKILGIFI